MVPILDPLVQVDHVLVGQALMHPEEMALADSIPAGWCREFGTRGVSLLPWYMM